QSYDRNTETKEQAALKNRLNSDIKLLNGLIDTTTVLTGELAKVFPISQKPPGGTSGPPQQRMQREGLPAPEYLRTRDAEQQPVNVNTSIKPLDTEGMQKREEAERQQKEKEQLE